MGVAVGTLAAAALLGLASRCALDTVVPSPDALPFDATFDGRTDGGSLADASALDGGFNPFKGSWGPIPGGFPHCEAKLALAPRTDVPPLRFDPCASARSGCSEAFATWAENPLVGAFLFRREPVRLLGNELTISYARFYRDARQLPARAIILAVEGVTSRNVLAAIGDFTDRPPSCIGHLGAGPSGVSAALLSTAAPDIEFLGTTDLQNGAGLVLSSVTLSELGSSAGGAVQFTSHGNRYFYLGMSKPFSVTIWDVLNAKSIVANQPKRIPAEGPIAVGDGALAIDNDVGGLWFLRTDGSYVHLVSPSNGQILFDVAVDRANGDAISWLEADQPQFDYINVNLWTAPYTTNPGAVQARKVATLGSPNRGGGWLVANAGMALTLRTRTSARLTRLQDGVGWTIQAEADERFVQPLWVDDQEVWLATGPDGSFSADYFTGILRLSRASLGPPTLDAGP